MERVGVRELRQNLSVYLRRVLDGETLEVTDRGQPVAVLAPLPTRRSALMRLVAQGRLARVARTSPTRLPAPALPAQGRPSLGELLEAERAERL